MLKRLSTALAFSLFVVIAGGCVKRQGISVVGARRFVAADDGFELLTFELTERGHDHPAHPRALMFYIQGSSCASALYAAELFAGATVIGIPVILSERRGVDEKGAVDEATCREFSTKGRRVADSLEVVKAYLADAPSDTPVILVGGSEGGDVAAAVATREPRVGYLILFGTGGGWSQAEELRYMVEHGDGYLGLHGTADLDRVLADIRRSPEALTMWAGLPYRRWSSFLWDPPLTDLLRLDIPIFLAHGALDDSVPVESARATRDAFAREGKKNLTYEEYDRADHTFRDPKTEVSYAPRIEVDLIRWLTRYGITTETEARRLDERVRKNHPELFARRQESP